jgi:hypothetical protein
MELRKQDEKNETQLSREAGFVNIADNFNNRYVQLRK